MQVTQLWTYPVKSLGGVPSDRATVTPIGLESDRRWALLDPDGHRISARECHEMLGITATPTSYGAELATRDGEVFALRAPGPDAALVPTRMSRVSELAAGDPQADAWISERLGRDLRFAYLADPAAREIGASHGGRPGETMSLADAGPILLVSEASVRRLADWVVETSQEPWIGPDEAVRRFRANVVIDGDEAFAEDGWERVRIGAATYRRGELCDRCVMTTIDLVTLRTTKEPIRTLARHRKWDGVTWFGVRLIPESGNVVQIAVGDRVVPE